MNSTSRCHVVIVACSQIAKSCVDHTARPGDPVREPLKESAGRRRYLPDSNASKASLLKRFILCFFSWSVLDFLLIVAVNGIDDLRASLESCCVTCTVHHSTLLNLFLCLKTVFLVIRTIWLIYQLDEP